MKIRHIFLAGFVCTLLSVKTYCGVCQTTLNGLSVSIDEQTGCLLELSYPSTGVILQAEPDLGGLLDVAYPVEEYIPLRLATRFSKASFVQEKDGLRIIWDQLGPSRTHISMPEGKVKAEVKLRAAPDEKSVILTCTIENHSQAQIPQILFPDFWGLKPFNGPEHTKLHLGNKTIKPFSGPVRDRNYGRFCVGPGSGWYRGTTVKADSNNTRRVDFFGPKVGISMIQNPACLPNQRIFPHRRESDPMSLRLMYEHKVTVGPGQKWQSGEIWLIPFETEKPNDTANVNIINLNGMEVGIDEKGGNIVHLFHPATGEIMECPPQSAGLIELEVSSEANEPLRLSSRFSKAKILKQNDSYLIRWDHLKSSPNSISAIEGKVAAEVKIRPSEDQKSWVMCCRIQNNSNVMIPTAKFPVLHELKAFHGPDKTRLRLSQTLSYPFTESGPHLYTTAQMKQKHAPQLRWLDLGSLKGGLSVFHKQWLTPIRANVMSDRQATPSANLTLSWEHPANIKPGEIWDSGEFCFTGHQGGWAKGIEIFRDYVQQVNPPRPIPLPNHLRDGLGFRTVWMMPMLETDPKKIFYKFKDIPELAAEAKDHGLDELVLWFWCEHFDIPMIAKEELGGEDGLIDGVCRAKELGVNVSLFTSIKFVKNPNKLKRYGMASTTKPVAYTYNPELIPNRDPYYIQEPYPVQPQTFFNISLTNKVWQEDMSRELNCWINKGCPSFTWDILVSSDSTAAEITDLFLAIRKQAMTIEPETTFSGELLMNPEFATQFADYTWNWWGTGRELLSAPMKNVLSTPRINVNIDTNSLDARKAFTTGLYLNVMPAAQDSSSATGCISEMPELSATLKELAALRRQFLPYFVEGYVIGDCVLSEQVPDVWVVGHQLGNKLLIIVLNDQDVPKQVVLKSDLSLWLPTAQVYQVKCYDTTGKNLKTTEWYEPDHWAVMIPALQPSEFAFFELSCEN